MNWLASLKTLTVASKNTLSYKLICNEPIHPSGLIKSYPPHWKLCMFAKFNNKEDPQQHLLAFKHTCCLIVHDHYLLLRTFPMSLFGPGLDLYNSIPRHSLFSFTKLAQLFLEHFSINITCKTTIIDLYTIRQFEDEPITDFFARWHGVINQLSFTIPQTELIELFSHSSAKHISSILHIQSF